MMQVIPAVDLLGDDAVRLERGDYNRVVARRPVSDYVAALVASGPPLLHVVDLDGARSGGVRHDVVGRVIRAAGAVPVQVSGGVRTVAAALDLVAAGAARVVIGTAAFGPRQTLGELVAALGDRLVVAIDVRAGRVAVAGWLDQTAISVEEALDRCRDLGVGRVLGTAISRDGTMAGPDLELTAQLCASGLRVLAAGGVRGDADLASLAQLGCEGAIVGRALYEQVPASPA
ncbi:MAG: 1-(5-phosphoribosyl)-5-[(5-phosphoribosylamino) methylideneamino]imidazole-4-carboxamide isomerase [Candidatus Dormibacteria bacterium]